MENESIEITIRNYRNIAYNNPITLKVKPGITFILGVNNVGKSNLLRFFLRIKAYFSSRRSFSREYSRTLYKGLAELLDADKYAEIPAGKIRRVGGGRKKILSKA
jgi:recombinational DNA repair ATPase RecF